MQLGPPWQNINHHPGAGSDLERTKKTFYSDVLGLEETAGTGPARSNSPGIGLYPGAGAPPWAS